MFDRFVTDAIRQHAMREYPRESCGVVTRDGYVPMDNIHPDPEHHFRLPPEADDMVATGDVLAVVHSHPDGPDHPSEADQRAQMDQDIPWGLCVVPSGIANEPFFWGDGIPDPPLMPRDFRWGPAGTDGKGDCLALVRTWYRQERGILIPDATRGPDWLSDGPTRYAEGALTRGFTYCSIDDLREGDLVLMAIQSGGKPNHAGIYLRGGRILHHLQGRLARVESFAAWRPAAAMFLRPPA